MQRNNYFDHPSPWAFGNTASMQRNLQKEKEEAKKEELEEELENEKVD